MKRVTLAALAISLMATSAMAQPRHWQGRDQDGQPGETRAERQDRPVQQQANPERPQRQERPQQQDRAQPQPQQQPQAAAVEQSQRGQGRWNREAQAPQVVQAQAPAPVQPQAQDRGDRGRGRWNGGATQTQAQAPVAPPQAVAQAPRDRRYQERPAGVTNSVSEVMAQRLREEQRSREQQQQAGRDGRSGQWDANRSGGDRSGGDRGQWNGDRRQAEANGWNRDGGRGGWDRNQRGPQERPSWARPDGRYDRDRGRQRYDVRRYPHFYQAPHRYRTTTYVVPYGFYDYGFNYSWSFGDYLPWGWYGPSYWIGDWFAYGLPPPPIGCEWVRVGYDALLIDTFDGRVLSVARLLFW